MIAWQYPDAVQRLSPWLRWSVAGAVGACTGFMVVRNFPWPLLLYIDAVLLGFGWAVMFHIAADQRSARVAGVSVSRELEGAHGAVDSRQLARRGWQLFGASLLLGVVGIGALILLFAGT